MIYNLSGLYYRIHAVGGVLLFLGILDLLLTLFLWKKEKKLLILSILSIVTSLIFTTSYLIKLNNLEIEVYEGSFESTYRATAGIPSVLPFDFEYHFTSEASNKEFFLDAFSKKDIFPADFIEGNQYRIYYEKSTRIIVGVENLTKVP